LRIKKWDVSMDKKNEKTSKTQPKGPVIPSEDLPDRAGALQSNVKDKIGAAKTFLREVRTEFDRITWPTRKETVAMAVAVLVLTVFFTVFLGLVDMTLGKLVSLVLS